MGREDYDPEEWAEMCERFSDPGGNSALYAETKTDKRRFKCGTCGKPNRLTARDKAAGYQCNECADRDEGKVGYGEY